jgi:30S ribosomal protein S31
MGKGDKSTKRGKIFSASYGNARPKTVSKKAVVKTATVAKPAARPAAKAATKAAPRKKA